MASYNVLKLHGFVLWLAYKKQFSGFHDFDHLKSQYDGFHHGLCGVAT